ncbi:MULTISPECIES: hypothetical protein [unclassified Rhodococcus (in: high G+C Gram-positive bacteria)]|uniref:hypothetical protein n=1 Tax=unclassified Rhodococcus (in: high G+C Gram-positive bacteria) TaxID=192944 RepID=UPI00117A7F2D|nr:MULTISPECIES: hypothetical protein [unclassified Rhodococcus (in: high G+C Gram-positive bacteria)]
MPEQEIVASSLGVGPIMKTCSRCKKSKSFDDFYEHEKAKDGRQSRCIECCRAVANVRKNKASEFARTAISLTQGVSAGDEEKIEIELINLLKQLQQKYSVKIDVSIRGGLVSAFNVMKA